MKPSKRKRLTDAGWKVGTAKELLGLSAEEADLIEMKLALSRSLKHYRLKQNLTQEQLAGQLGSSQSRVAKMEVADRSVSIDLLVRSLLAVGATRRDLGRIIARDSDAPAA